MQINMAFFSTKNNRKYDKNKFVNNNGTISDKATGWVDFPVYWTSTTHKNTYGTYSANYIAFGRALGWMKNRRTGNTHYWTFTALRDKGMQSDNK